MLKRIMCALLAGALVVTLTACGKEATGSEVSKEPEGEGVIVNEFSGSELSDKDYDGAYFRFLYWYQPSEYAQRKIAAFNKKHNANVEISITSDGLDTELAKSVASGMPYDIIANHGNYYPSLINSDLLEPLDSYITDAEMSNSKNPTAGGLSADVLKSFQWGGKYYAAGSAKSIYSDVFMYNKKMFNDAGLEDPWELYQNGKWTWDKFMEMAVSVSDIANEISFLEKPSLQVWLTLNCIDPILRDGDNFTENLTNADLIKVTQDYKDLFLGDTPISRTAGAGGVDFFAGKAYTCISQTDGYTQYSKKAATSSAFGKDANNLGCVPIPTMPYNTTGKYPGHAPQGYSVGKGSSDPSVAVCYALFESTLEDSDIAVSGQLPAEIRNEIDNLFAKNGFISYCGFKDSNGQNVAKAFSTMEKTIIQGGDVTATLNSNRNVITRLISDSLS